MAGKDRATSNLVELLEQLKHEPYAFDFFQAIRLLDCTRPDKPQTGHSTSLKDDPFRLTQEPSQAFAPATLAELTPSTEDHPPLVVQRFMGLLGPQGPLPLHLTEYARSRIRHHNDFTFARFLDIFHHRMVALFYKCWARVRPTVNFDRGSRDRFGEYVESLFGLGMPSLANRDALPDLAKRHFAGLLSCQTKNAEGLLAILRGYFCLPVDIEQLVGQWIELPSDCRCYMGATAAVSKLGQTITMGSHVWDCQQKFRVVMGPLSLAAYYQLLPGRLEAISPAQASESGRTLSEEKRGARADSVEIEATQTADAIYANGKIYTVNKEQPWAEAVAIKNGRFMAIGSNVDIHQLRGHDTKFVDLAGAMVIPGWHYLPTDLSHERSAKHYAAFPPTATLEEIKGSIDQVVAKAREGEWIEGRVGDLRIFDGDPQKSLLDEFVPNHPAIFRDQSGNTAWANSKALEVAEITNETPNPENGVIIRDVHTGEPTGELHGTATKLFDELIPMSTPELRLRALAESTSEFTRQGITTVQTDGTLETDLQSDQTLEGVNELPFRMVAGIKQSELHATGPSEPGVLPDSSPWRTLQSLVTLGRLPGSSADKDATTGQAMDLAAAIEMLTLQRAAKTNQQHNVGSIEIGKYADMVVISQHLFDLIEANRADAVGETKALATVFGGRVVYDALIDSSEAKEFWNDTASESKQSDRVSLDSLIALVRGYVGDDLQWDLQLILAQQETPPLGLGIQGHLGWTTWLIRDKISRDCDDLVLDAMDSSNELAKLYWQDIPQWDYQTLGQRLDGTMVLATQGRHDLIK